MPRSRDDERVEETGEDEEQAKKGGASAGSEACDELTREAEALGMYWGTGIIAHLCQNEGKCATEPGSSGYCDPCFQKIKQMLNSHEYGE